MHVGASWPCTDDARTSTTCALQDTCLRAVKPFASQADLDRHAAQAHGTAVAGETSI
jgi:hypothetical protein